MMLTHPTYLVPRFLPALVRRAALAAAATIMLSVGTAEGAATGNGVLQNHAAPAQATLKYDIVVDSPTITLTDILDGAEKAPEIVLARAPRPGERIALSPIAVAQIAASNGISWLPPYGLHRIMVTRASAIVPMEDIRAEIELALSAATQGHELDVEISGRRTAMHVPTDADTTVAVESMDYEPRTGRFTATVSAPAGDPTAERVRITGRAFPVIDVPVLTRSVRPGEEITPADIAWQRVRENKVRRNTVLDAAEMVGMSPKRLIAPQRLVRVSDLQTPVMIAKGDIVTMVYRHGTLLLTATGRAMENAGRNEVIKVMNDRSRLMVEARAIGAGHVEVQPASTRLSQLSR